MCIDSRTLPQDCLRRTLRRTLLLALCLAGGCYDTEAADYQPAFGDAPANAARGPVYRFGILPLHSSLRLFDAYYPLADAINERARDFTVHIQTSGDYPIHDAGLRQRDFDIAVVNPYQAIQAEHSGYRIFAKMSDDDRFRGIIVVRKGSGIDEPADLRGANVSFPAPTAMAATLMTKVFLKQHGLDVEADARPHYVGSHDSAIMNVYLGLTRAGGTRPQAWTAMQREQPEVTAVLEVKWQTDSLPNLALVARDDLPEEHLRTLSRVLFGLHESEAGREVLRRMEVSRFEPAVSSAYDPVRRFLDEYERLFGHAPASEGAE